LCHNCLTQRNEQQAVGQQTGKYEVKNGKIVKVGKERFKQKGENQVQKQNLQAKARDI